MRFLMRLTLILLMSLLGACTKKASSSGAILSSYDLVTRGQSVYMSNCISCHNVDPKKDGAVGPAVWGSSLELLQARVLRASYPAGYKPKKESAQMPALPHLEKELPALEAFLKQ